MEIDPLWFGELTVTAFFAIAFLQSATDKWIDHKGNLDFLGEHFGSSPLRTLVFPMFWVITVLESIAGILCSVGALQILLGGGTSLALWGLAASIISLLCLFLGQRLAKDYGGSVVIASYFAVALIGLILMEFSPPS